ncbi:MAG: hypothetical protein QOD93_2606 [Acetobacteraceae bacterium]|nr:hypothetical protein [Acetobacteraceae bacterium]
MAAFIHDIFANFLYLAGRYRDLPGLILLPCLALSVPFLARQIAFSARWLEPVALVVASAIILMLAWTSGSYLGNTGYLDHVEASIAAVSWWYHNGHPLYPGWNDGEGLYGLQYGPLLFQSAAVALSLGPSILISKLPGFCCFWLACGSVAWALRPSLPSVRQSLLPIAVVAAMAGGYWRAAYWVRSEPYLLLFAGLALCSYVRLGPIAAAVAIGLLGGCAVGMKIHGGLYILPYAVALLVSPGLAGVRVRIAVIGVVCGIFAAVLPFLDPDVSLVHYAAYLGTALNHGLDRSLLILNVRFGAVLMMPVLFLAWRHVRGEKQPELLMGLVYCACVAVVCVIGGKRGAGPTHLLPFLPAFVFFVMRCAQSVRIPGNQDVRRGTLAVCFLVLSIAYLPSFVSNLIKLQAWDRAVDDPAFRREATQLYAEYPTAIMGAGGEQSYPLTEYKVIGVFAGGPLVFDTTTWMDLQKGGVADALTQRLLIGCRSPFWIIPNGGEPFTQVAAYDPDLLFSDRFRQLFHEGYKPIRKGEFYSVWSCRS